MVFHQVGQAGLEFLTSGDPPASTSQSAGITGVSYYAQLGFFYVVEFVNLFCYGFWISESQLKRSSQFQGYKEFLQSGILL